MGIQVDYYGVNCYTIGSLIWVVVVEIYIVVLQAIAIVLAIKTRHVKVEAVNDSKEVVAVVYIVTACSIASIVIPFVLQNYSNISEGLYLTAVLVGTSSAVILMFVPKVVTKEKFVYKLCNYRCGPYTKTLMGKMFLNSSQ